MEKQYEDNYYNNYSLLSTNLGNGSGKFKRIYQMSSPVQIQSYGSNNFIVELKYKGKNKNNDEYDYIENELKSTKKTKAYTTYTEISNEESLFFCAQNPPKNQRYYKDCSHYYYNNFYPENIFNSTNNFFIEKNNSNFQPLKKEEIDTLFYPGDKIYLPKNNLNSLKQNRNELKYQRFCASFISKNPNSNNNSPKKKIIFQKKMNNINKIIVPAQKRIGVLRSKNQLEEYNIDKLKEIGDNFAMRCFNRINEQKRMNYHRRENGNIINNTDAFTDKNEKHDGLINKMIKIEEKRKESKNKMNFINRTGDKLIKRKTKINLDNKNFEKKSLNDNNNIITSTNILKMNKEILEKIKKSPSPKPNKINIINVVKRKKYNYINNGELERKNLNLNFKDNNCEKKVKYKMSPNQNKVYTRINNKSYINIKNPNSDKKFISTNSIRNSINVNRRIILDKFINNENIKPKNINHNYLESINIKSNKKLKKTQHSFNNVFAPLQKK